LYNRTIEIGYTTMTILIQDTEVRVRQSKYHKGFDNDLKTSQELVDLTASYLISRDFLVRAQDDQVPFRGKNGIIRLADIVALRNNKIYGFEAKDHGRCLYYQVTGYPKSYIDDVLAKFNNGENAFIIFRENMEVVNGRADIWKSTPDKVLDVMCEEGFAIRRDDGSINFVPYGNRLSVLMRPENMRTDLEPKILSRLRKYNKEQQYLWKISSMLRLDDLVEREFFLDITND